MATAALGAGDMLVSPALATTPTIDHYISTGDNWYVGTFLPVDSPDAIDASFDLLKNVFGVRRIYWRGLQESKYTEGSARPENVVIYKNILNSRDLIQNQNMNQVAAAAAHARGMQIWGLDGLYDWGAAAKDPIFYGFPGEQEHYLRTQNPSWLPVDKYGDRSQGGDIEFAYPAARQAVVNWVTSEVQQAGYDGVFFHTYNENFTMRFPDEFGFSDPIVNDFKSTYGVDIRKQSFNRQNWYDLRGTYTTQLLSQLHTAMSALGKGVGMAINPIALDKGRYWGTNFADIGNITMDWNTWAHSHYVDELGIWGSVPDAFNTVQTAVQGTGVETSLLTSDIYYPPQSSILNSGAPVVGSYNYDEDYLLRSNIPSQPISSLSSPNVYYRMRVLAQIINGDTTATASQVTPLLSDSNLITRRLALKALGKIADASSIPSIEAALSDSETSVRAAALYQLAIINRPESAQAILNCLANYSNSQLIEGAVAALRTIPTSLSLLETTVQTSSDPNVRGAAMRALAQSNSTIPASMITTFINAQNDSEPYVRAFATDGLGRFYASTAGVNALINSLGSTDPILSDRAATVLRNELKATDPSAQARRAEIINGMESLFRKQGDDSVRSDADWGYRQVGYAMFDLVPDGITRLQTLINQRTDRQTSLHAWDVFRFHQALGTFTSVTEANDAYAHFKKPHWDNIIAANDSFDLKAQGSPINGQSAEVGQTWTVTAGNSADQVVQSTINNGGKALKVIRRVGGSQSVQLASDSWDGQAAELTTLTAKADWRRPTTGDVAAFGLDIGPGIEAQFLVDPNSYYNVWQTDGTQSGGSYVQTSFKAGTGGWETVEVVAKYNLATGTTLTGTYDVYLSREGNDSLGGLGRTKIASNIPLHSIAEQTNQQLFISNQPNAASDVTTYWDNVSLKVSPNGLTAFPARVDINGGAIADAHPTNASYLSWDNLPSNASGAQNGYGTIASVSRQVWTAGVSSNLIVSTISSVDISGGTYSSDGPRLNSRDQSLPGREFNNSGSFTPTKDSLYRDNVSAEVGTATVNNGTNHRMELKLTGLDPDTSYQVKLYAYDNGNQRSVNVFTDVTSNPTVALPSANSANGSFTPGEGAAGTQWAPSQQYIDGTILPTFPTNDDFRALTLYLKSDSSGQIILDQTTVTGLSGTIQTLPILNGFEVSSGQSTWNGANGASWNTAGNWLEGTAPTGKGRNATFAGAGGSVTIASPVSVGFINFTGSNYTLSGATLTLDDNSVNSSVSGSVTGRAAIAVGTTGSFNQVITAPVVLNKDTTVTVTLPTERLTLSNLQQSNAWLTKAGAGALAINNARTSGLAVNAGTVSVIAGRSTSGTSSVGALVIAGGAALDLNDQDMIASKLGTTLAAVRSLLASGYNGGNWNGTGIKSSVASANDMTPGAHSTALGYADNALLGYSTFSGQPVNASSILIRYTYSGDGNVDGVVDTVDFNVLVANFGATGTGWMGGDYDYNNTVDSVDFNLLASNFGLVLPGSTSPSGANNPVGSLIPEPSSIAVLALAATAGLRRRRATR